MSWLSSSLPNPFNFERELIRAWQNHWLTAMGCGVLPRSSASYQLFLSIRNGFGKISGSFRSGLSILSTNKSLKEDEEGGDGDESFGEDHGGGDGGGIVGVMDEDLQFAQEVSMRPEFCVDFPLSMSIDNQIMSCLFFYGIQLTVAFILVQLCAFSVVLISGFFNYYHYHYYS
uniref:Uncharacterized protein n=1 Tax=Nelumbo nucifera TaxID=4432 RepID=A0A822Y4E5_NELNU|nr:TPA_asm: hypothetical protein HUJ06_028878 [Nelumbo nucifera]